MSIANMKVNLLLSPVANILAVLNAANPGKGFNESNLAIGVPKVLVGGNGGRNTSVELTALLDAGFSGVATVNYTRQALEVGGAIATAKAVKVLVLGTDTEAEILTKVSVALGLMESELTIGDVVIPLNEHNDGEAVITANVDSLLYTGNYLVELEVADTDVPLMDAITTFDLDGFEAEE